MFFALVTLLLPLLAWFKVTMVQVDENAFTRKQGLFVLEHASKHGAEPGGQAWQALLHALALLEDFALHLIQVSRPHSIIPNLLSKLGLVRCTNNHQRILSDVNCSN